MKKGITPIIAVIILLLITVALAGMAWAFLSGYFTSMTGQTIQVVGASCGGTSTSKVIVRNMGTQTIDLGACTTAGDLSGGSTTCGGVTIVKATGGVLNGNLDKTSLAPNTNVVITDVCTTPAVCSYNVFTTGAGTPTGATTASSVGPCS